MKYLLNNTFATSDEHHDHTKLIEYVGRPFKNAKAVTKAIIERHNDAVNDNSVVWHLGDFSMVGPSRIHFYHRLLEKYRPVKARHLVLGNHDQLKVSQYLDIGFTTVHTAFWMNVEGHDFLLGHDPAIYQPAVHSYIMLCGHLHVVFKTLPNLKVVNVGVDVWDFTPVSFESIINLLCLEGKLP